jgi:hypothetical protein
MIVDGKEVNVNYRAAQAVQQRIDVQQDIPETAKVELPKKEIKELSQEFNSYGGFESQAFGELYGSQNNTLNTNPNLQENRYSYYQLFEEMDSCPFLHRGLQVIADDACQKNTDGDTVKVYSDDEDIKEILEELFHERLNLNKELWSIIFETIKKGDNFYEIIPDDYEHPTMVARIRYLEPHKVNRIEKNGKLAFYTYKTTLDSDTDYLTGTDSRRQQTEVVYKLQPWQIIHFKIANKKFLPYGGSLLDPGIQTYKRYTMLEDAMMIYRLARVPERRVFKIDVGNLSTTEAMRAIRKIKDNYRSNQIMDDQGRINKQAAALSLTQDIFVPVREGQQGTEITTLAPGNALNNIDDIRHFRDELLWTLNIPPEYLGFTSDQGSGMAGKGSLAMQDVKFARFVERVQYYVEEGLTKIAAIELFFKKKKKADLKNFKLELTPPSNVKEIMDIEYLNQKISLISTMLGTGLFPKDFILKYVMKMSKKEIADINLQKDIEASSLAAMQGGMGMDMGMGGGMPVGGGMGAPMDAGANMPMPAMSVVTEELTPEKMVKVFGKDVLIEHKEDYAKLMEALEEYKKDVAARKEKLLVEEDLNNNEFLAKVRELLISEEKETTNTVASSIYYENELGGLNFSDKEFTIYGKPKKRTGPSSSKSSRLITEEITRKLK